VAVPGVVAADLVVVEADFVLRGLEAFLDRPPGAGDADEFLVGGAVWAVAQVIGEFGGVGDAAADQQPAAAAVFGGAGVGQRSDGPVVEAGTFDAVAPATAFLCRIRCAGGEGVRAGTAGLGGNLLVAGHGEHVADTPALQAEAELSFLRPQAEALLAADFIETVWSSTSG
jgi:hypothetical protein